MRTAAMFALILLLAGAAGAQDPPCYVCAQSDVTGTTCHRLVIPNFSQDKCDLRCYFFYTQVCFCRTVGNECGISNSAEPDQGLDRGVRFSLPDSIAERIHKEAGEIVRGFMDWEIPNQLQGDGPHVIRGQVAIDKVPYDFTGEIRFHFGIASIRYDLEGHPEFKSIMADIGPLGSGGGVQVIRTDGSEQWINLNPEKLPGPESYGVIR